MPFTDSFSKVGTVVTTGCTLCAAIGGVTAALLTYKAKIDSIDTLQVRIAQLEARAPGSAAIIGPEGPKGQDGKIGKQGDVGPQGDRGLPGPKGDSGMSPPQIAEFEKRIIALEKRPPASRQLPGGAQLASAEPAETTVTMPTGIHKNPDGCFFFTPDANEFSITVSVSDRFCRLDGSKGFSVRGITDSAIAYTSTGDGTAECRIGNSCPTYTIDNIFIAPQKISMSSSGKLTALVRFERHR